MQLIHDTKKDIASILGKQSYVANKKYRHCAFLIEEDFDDGQHVIYNNMTKAVVVLDPLEAEAFNNINFSNSTVKELFEKYFIVPVEFDELYAFDEIKSLYSFIKKEKFNKNEINSFVILPTTNCNARCYYCFEEGCKSKTMTQQTANDVAKFMIKNNVSNKIHISWFGGEPTLCKKNIDIISQHIKDAGIDYKSSMISNAYLFDAPLVKKAKKLWKLKDIQITLDGTEDEYNKVKSYVCADKDKSKSPFKRVLNNIRLLMDEGIFVRLRLHLNQNNQQDIVNLINILEQNFVNYTKPDSEGNRLLTIYVHSLYDDIDDAQKNSSKASFSLQEIRKNELFLEKILFDKGLSCQCKLGRSIEIYCCMADNPSSIVILPDGSLSLCEFFVDGQQTVGNIYSGLTNQKLIKSWKQILPTTEKCGTCAYYPNCKRLKNCPGTYKNCLEPERKWRLSMLHMQLRHTYNKWKGNYEN